MRLAKLMALLVCVSILVVGCGPTPEPEIVEKTVIETVEVEKTVVETVVETVEVEKEVQVVETVEVEKEVQVVETVEVEVTRVVEAPPLPPGPAEAGSMTVCSPGCQPQDGGTLSIGGFGEVLPYPWKSDENNYFTILTYDRLFEIDPYSNALIPSLATEVEVSDDKTVGTYHLREGVTFHDGEPFTANDVAWSLKLTMKPEAEGAGFLMNASRLTELKGAQDFIDGTTDDVAGIRVIDDNTIELETEVPNAQFFDLVGRVYILPEHLFVDTAWGDLLTLDWLSPDVRVGTGPFKLEEYVEGQYTSFVANEDYWAGRPYLDRVVHRDFAEHETATLAFEAGEIDWLYQLTAEEVKRFSEDNPEGYVFLLGAALSPNYINLGDKPYFEDKRVRQAISHAINRQELIDTLTEPGMKSPMDSIFPPDHPYYNPDAARYPYDPDRARELLAEAGWDPNQEIELATYYETQEALDWMAFIQMYLSRVGIKATIRAMPWPDMEVAGQEGRLDLWFNGYSPDVIGDHMANYGPDGAWNYFQYDNPEYTELLTEASRAGGDEAKDLFFQMQEIFNEDLPGIPFWNRTKFDLVQPKFCGVASPWTDQHYGYLNYQNIYVCEDAESVETVRPQTPEGVGHPGYTAP